MPIAGGSGCVEDEAGVVATVERVSGENGEEEGPLMKETGEGERDDEGAESEMLCPFAPFSSRDGSFPISNPSILLKSLVFLACTFV